MGRQLFRALWAHGFIRSPERPDEQSAPRRRILLERLEDRLLFDAGPVAPMDADLAAAQAQAESAQQALQDAASIAAPAEVRLIAPLDNVGEVVADLTSSAINREPELIPGVDASKSATVDGTTTSAIDSNPDGAAPAGATLNSEQVAQQLLTTSDEQRSELQAATADVRHELVFVDVAVEDYQALLAGVDPLAEVVLLDPTRDGVEQIAEVLSQRSGLDAIHIVSHGSMGELQLGTATLNLDSMYDRYAEQLGRIGQALAVDADILIYGCNFAEGLLGRAAEESLARLTGADVAASSDATGNTALGGDWDLERSVGVIESNIAFGAQAQGDWQYLLAVLDWDTVDWSSGSLNQSFSVGGGTVSFSITGDTDDFLSGSPDDDTTNTGGLSPVQESVLLDMNFESQAALGDEAVTVTIGFSHTGGVSNVSFTIFDVDLNSWTDQVIVTANNGATINPSSVTVGSTVTFNGASMVTGTASNSSTSANGNATFTFNQAAITQVTLVYRSGRLADPSVQFISLHDITFNAAPVLDLDASSAGTGFSNTFTEDDVAVRIADTDSLITDTDSTNLNRATITLTNPQTSDLLSVSGSLPSGISLDPSSTSTLIVLTGSSSLANYETAIEQIRFSNSSQTPNTTARTITVNVRDTSNSTSNTATSTISVVSVNDAPTTSNNTVTTAEDTPFTFSASDFPFSDVDGDSLQSVRITSLPGNGTLTLSGVAVTASQVIPVANLGNLVFTPDLNQNGSPLAVFDFRVSDGTSESAGATMRVNVTPVNDAPSGGDQTVTTAEDTDFTFTISDFPFSDVDGETLARVRIDTLPADGTVLLSGVAVSAGQVITAANITAGDLQFRPDTNENGSPYTAFTFSVGDASTFVASPSTMTVNVTAVNDAPIGADQTVTTSEDTDFTFSTSDFPFSDVEGDSLSRVRIDTLPVDGTVLLGGVAVTAGQIITAVEIAVGDLIFRPDANENGSPYTTFTFTVVVAGSSAASSNTMTVNVTPVNDAPSGGDQTVTTAEDTDFTFASADFPFSDVDGGSLARVRIDSLPADGTVLLSGTAVTTGQMITAANITAGNLTFRPDANENGSPYTTFTFSVGDATTFATSPSTLTVNVTPVNDPPVADDETFTVGEGDFVIIPVLIGDTDLEGDSLTVTQVDGTPISVGSPVTVATGVVSLNADGTLTFAPLLDYNGPATFNYTVSDGNGGSDIGNVSGDVTAVNDPPVAVADSATTPADMTASGNVLTNDSDPDGDILTVSAVGGAAINVGSAVTGSNGGSFTINADGSFTFDPGTDFDDLAIGDSRSTTITYTASDGNGGTSSAALTITVTGANNSPTSTALPDRANDDSDVVNISVSGAFSDPDTGDVLTFSAMNLPLSLTLNPTSGAITGTLDNDASVGSPYSVTITATDLAGEFTSQTFVWTVTNIATSPFDDFDSTTENTPVSGNVLANDVDPDGDPLIVGAVNGAAGNVGIAVAGTQGGSFQIETDGSYTFNPGTDFDDLAVGELRSTSIRYTSDDNNGSMVEARLTVTVTGTNDAPTSTAIPAQTSQDTDAVTFAVASHFSDTDASDTFVFSATGLPTGLLIDPDTGVISGTIDHSASVNSPYSVAVTATDPAEAATSQTFSWTVTNPPPTAANDSFTTSEDTPRNGSVTANDSDPDGDTLTYTLGTGPLNGLLAFNSDGTFTYTPNLNFVGPDSFSYQVSDGEGGTATATVSLAVTTVNDAPTGADHTVTTAEDTDFVFSASDFQFSDVDGDPLSEVRIDSLPVEGTLLLNGVVVSANDVIDVADINAGLLIFRPAANDNGSPYATFDFSVSDGTLFAALPSTQTVHVTSVNDPPVADDESVITNEDTPVVIDVLNGDTDLDGTLDPTSVIITSTPPGATLSPDGKSLIVPGEGTWTVDAVSGAITFTPEANYTGSVTTITYRVADDQGATDTADVSVAIVAVNNAPTSADHTVTTPEDTDFVFSASDFPFNDVEGDPLTAVRIDLPPANGNLLLDGTAVSESDVIDVADINAGLLVFRPDTNENGSPYTTFNFSVSDGSSFAAAPSTMTINVTPTAVSVAKSLFDSSDPNTLGSDVTIGEELCFALLVTLSEGNSTDLILTDLLPDGLAYDSFTLITAAASSNGLLTTDINGSVPVPSVSGGTFDGEDVTFTFGATTVAADSDATNNSFVLLVHAFVSDIPNNHNPLSGTPVLTNSVTADVSNPQPPISSNSFDVMVVEPDLSVTIDNGVATLTAGQTTTYSITISNDGDSVATGVELSGSLPIDRVSFVSTDDAANFSIDGSGNFTWTPAVASLTPSGSLTLLLTVQVSSSLDSGITDVTIPVSVTHNNIEPTPANNSATDIDTLDASPDLRLTKTDFTNSISPGQGSVYTINIANAGTQAATNVLVTETVPTGTTFNAALSDPLWTLIAPDMYQISLPTFAAGAGFNANFSVTVNSPATPGQNDIVNTVTISDDGANGLDPNPGDNSATDTNTLVSVPDYQITISDGELVVVPGQSLSYVITFTNGGDQDGTGVVVFDTFPTTILENVVASDGGVVDDVAGAITWNVGNLAAGESRSFTVTAKVRDSVPAGVDDFTHETSITDDLANGADPTPGDDVAVDTDTLDATPDYHIAITDGETAVTPGQSLSYTVSFLNAGNQDGTGVVVSDTFPPEILENVVASDGGIVDAVAGTITWNVGNLAAAESRSFTVTAKVRDTIPAGFDDFAHSTTITDDAANGADPTAADNSAADTDTLDAQPDYQISIDDGVLSATTGQSLTYSVTFANAGLQDGTGVMMSSSFPLSVLTNVVASNGGVVDMTSGTIVWNVGSLAAGAAMTYTVTADVLSSVAAGIDDFTHSTAITDDGTNGSDPTPADNSASDTDTLDAAPDLRLTKTDFTDTISPGQGSVYTLNVGNLGTQGATNVSVFETAPVGTTFNAALSDPAWVDLGNNVYQYSILSLPAGAAFNVNFSVLIDNPALAGLDLIINSATIADDGVNGSDLDPANDSATDINTLDAVPNYDIGIDDLQDSATPGESLTYFVNFNNSGLQNGTGVVITATFPTAILTNVASSDGGEVDAVAGTITWNVGPLAANDPHTFEFTADVRAVVPAGVNDFTLGVSIADDGVNGSDPDLSDNSSSDTNTLNAQPDYAITIDDGESFVRPGDLLTHVIQLANNGNQDGTGVVVTVNFPTTLLENVTASGGGIVDAAAGTITWNLGDLPAGGSQTLTVASQVRQIFDANIPSITLTATITDDGANGADPTSDNNSGSDVDRLQFYAYDSFHDWKEMRFGFLTPQMAAVGQPLAPLPVDPIFSGLTEPGTLLVGRIYDKDGRMLGDRQVVADAGGNWLMTFPNILIFEQPHRMEILVTPAISNVAHENGFNLRRYFHPAIHTELFMNESLSVAGVFRNRAYNIVEAQHAANTHPLSFQWYSHAYELNAASSNVSQR